MTSIFKKIGAFVLPTAALSLSVLGLAAGTNAQSADEDTAAPGDMPMQCQISVTKGGFGYTYAGVLHADEAVQGSYELTLSGRGGGRTNISQSGVFSVKAGGTQTLGQATLGGMSPDSVDAQLILHVDGKSYVCGTQTDI